MNATEAFAETAHAAGDKWCEDFWCVQLAGAVTAGWVAENEENAEAFDSWVDGML